MAAKVKSARLKRGLWAEVHGCALSVPLPCHWCVWRISFAQARVDHVRPRSEGGANDCNQLRNKLTEDGVWGRFA